MDEKLKFITAILGATDTEIAERAGLPKETMSRLRNGSRKLKKNSKQLAKLVNGIYDYANAHLQISRLRASINCSAEDEAGIKAKLSEWFLDGESPAESGLEKLPKHRRARRKSELERDLSSFGNRLKALMKLADISNAWLAEVVRVDDSYISRLRTNPSFKTESQTVEKISECLAERIAACGKEMQLSKLTGIPEVILRQQGCQTYLRDFLLWRGDYSARGAIGEFLAYLRNVSKEVDMVLPTKEEVLWELEKTAEGAVHVDKDGLHQTRIYVGRDGLQQAVLRFLADIVNGRDKEIYLYSDQSMQWMEGGFAAKWFVMMRECLQNGAKVRIIHNIDRKIPEMLKAIRLWLPLYMSGQVESHYSTQNPGERFSHCIFIGNTAMVAGACAAGSEEKCLYHYYTEREELQAGRDTFECLSANAERLFEFRSCPAHLSGQYHIYNLGDMEICIGRDNVIVNKLTEPYLSFEFRHTLMVRAFREYVGEKEK